MPRLFYWRFTDNQPARQTTTYYAANENFAASSISTCLFQIFLFRRSSFYTQSSARANGGRNGDAQLLKINDQEFPSAKQNSSQDPDQSPNQDTTSGELVEPKQKNLKKKKKKLVCVLCLPFVLKDPRLWVGLLKIIPQHYSLTTATLYL